MLRFMAPYLAICFALTVVSGVLYGRSVINATGVYCIEAVALLTCIHGYARWDERQHPR